MFSSESVGKYSAFEEIDLVDDFDARERAVLLTAEHDPCAVLLIAIHFYSLRKHGFWTVVLGWCLSYLFT